MKFAFIIFKYFPFGGMQRDMLRTAKELLKRGHQVEIFTLSWQGDVPSGIKVHVLPQTGWFNFQRYQKFIDASFAIIQSGKFDFVFGYNRMAGLNAHFAADPCFIERAHQQRSWWYRLTPRYRWFAKCEYAVFSKQVNTDILAVSLSEQPHFQHWYGTQNERFHFIPPFLSPERFVLQDKVTMRKHLRDAFGFAQDDFVYMLTGSGFAMKGLDRAILAMAALPSELLQHTKLIAVGQDKPKQFQAMANRLGLQSHVVISKGRSDIPLLMQGADVCVHPAYRENTGLVILEGMACGAPMLVTESCGYAHHVADAQAGIVIPMPFNQALMNQQWLAMRTSSNAQRETWAQNGLSHLQGVMRANDGSAEAKILIQLAEQVKA
ncbi:MAG: glycosyl transferase family 1 [Methylophilaceae bacterium 17-44-8]|nr:MAG: glycosyl transferase family 1 [Methylophilales bacterium 28-44-11]OZA05586.1 MAG: glycosyl transferase family 1 [Methylophilaceae bacterium 17-44-8]